MNVTIWQSKLLQLWRERNGYGVLALGLLLTNLLQLMIIVRLSGHWHTVIVPAHFSQALSLNESSISESYLAEMTQYFSTLILDITPESAPFQREKLLQYVEPSGYGRLKNQLIQNEDKIKNQAISTGFYPVEIKADSKQLVAIITGDLKTYVGQELTSTIRQSYCAHYRYHNGRLLLQSFQEVKKDEH